LSACAFTEWAAVRRVRESAITKERTMNKKAKSNQQTKGSKLSFKRETVRTLSAQEAAHVVGGKPCLPDSCRLPTCPRSVCTITVDPTL